MREAAPAFVDEVTFKADSSGEKHTLVVINAPSMTRIDAPDDRFSILYNPATQYYIGLEMSNYTYWEFSWPVVRKAVEGTSRYATRLRDMGPELMEEDAVTPPATSSVALTGTEAGPTDSVGGDDSGYVWRTTIEKKQIAGFTCQHWIGETVAGETIDAWCTAGLQPPLERAIATLKEINEPMALVPVRELVPPLVFVAWSTLTKGGVTPIEMKWGGDADANRFAFVSAKTAGGQGQLFPDPESLSPNHPSLDGRHRQSEGDRNPTRPERGAIGHRALYPLADALAVWQASGHARGLRAGLPAGNRGHSFCRVNPRRLSADRQARPAQPG